MSLLSALYTGVSGLQTFGDSLQVIGDNIANVNTVGFKSSRSEFADLLSQTINGGSGRSQLGRGVTLNRISASFAQGSFSNTDRLTDMAINGNGFFIVSNPNSPDLQYYTRNGQFSINSTGEIVTGNGMNVMGYGYNTDGVLNPNELIPLKIANDKAPPHATGDGSSGSGVSIQMNFKSEETPQVFNLATPADTSNFSTAVTVYDQNGAGHQMQIYFNKTSATAWQWHAVVDGADLAGGTPGVNVEGGSGTLNFNADGTLSGITGTTAAFDFDGTGAQTIGMNFDPENTTQFANISTVITSISQDGYSAGDLNSIQIGEGGTISGLYSNGQTMPIGQLVLANFTNLTGLYKAGSSLYTQTADSGIPTLSQPNDNGFGSIASYTLELSNVDIATEFVSLIANQRAYQANSKIITVGDQLLSEIVNIIR